MAVSIARREEWFEPIETPLVLWWVAPGTRPSLEDGVERLEHLKAQGPSDDAFGWEHLPDATLWQTQRGAKAAIRNQARDHAAVATP